MIFSHSPDAQHCSRPPCHSSDTASHCRHFPGQEPPISHSGLQRQGSLQQVPHHFPQGFVKQHLHGMHLRLGSLAVSVLGGDQQCFQPGTGFARAEPKESAAFQLHSSPVCEAWQAGPRGGAGDAAPTAEGHHQKNQRPICSPPLTCHTAKGRAASESRAQAGTHTDHSLGSSRHSVPSLCTLRCHLWQAVLGE